MNELFQWFWQHPLVELMGWTLVHFLWQGLVVAGPLALSLWALRFHSASVRYYTACAGLIVLSICPVVTLTLLVRESDPTRWRPTREFSGHSALINLSEPKQASIEQRVDRAWPVKDSSLQQTAFFEPTITAWEPSLVDGSSWWSVRGRWMPIIATVWLTGVLLLTLRLLGGLWRVRCLRRRAEKVVDLRIKQSLDRLLARMNFRGPLALFQSCELTVPAVIGFWRPVLIVPASLLSGLTVSEVESILAHELAHVRRHDWIVNVVQSFLETLLFYHPVVWWVSAVIRRERENCCDDMAIQVCGDRLTLAKALLRLEEERCATGLALSAAGGSLAQRIRRLILPHDRRPSLHWTAGLLTLAVALMLVGGWWVTVLAGVSVSQEIARRNEGQQGSTSPKLSVLERDKDRTTVAELRSRETGRSHEELRSKFVQKIGNRPEPLPRQIIDEETLVSSREVEYVLPTDYGAGMDAAEIVLHLPDGSGVWAEFMGEDVSISSNGPESKVTISNGRIKLLDFKGVVRVDASADNGAELLLANVREIDDELVVTLRAAFRNPAEHDFTPVVQAKLYLENEAAAGEEEPPHGTVRYGIDHDPQTRYAPMSMMMRWHYDLARLMPENPSRDNAGDPNSSTRIEPGKSEPSSLRSQDEPTSEKHSADEPEWGRLAEISGLQSRLTQQTKSPKVGEPLLVKLELRNAGEKPTEFDPQDYFPFRVLRVDLPRPELPPPFIGSRPQTSGKKETLQPGEVRTLWENVDVAELFLLAEAREYEVFAEGGEWAAQTMWRDSNHLQVKLGPGTLRPREQLIANLVKIKPDDWTVNVGHGEIFLQHSPTNLKSDVHTIAVRFQAEKIAADFQVGWPVPGQDKVFANANVDDLGETTLGYVYVLSLPKSTKELWPTYVADITKALEDLRLAPVPPPQPWSAKGRVTNQDGKPLANVAVQAHCGMGSLKRTGTTLTDADGYYDLRFGPGLLSSDSISVQVATISVQLAGHFEQNLHRQGDCWAALQKPSADVTWPGQTDENLFLPGRTKELNFVMFPSAKLTGIVTDPSGEPLDGMRISLVGDDLPPSSSVVTNTLTDKGGRFELGDIPTGYDWQLLIEPAKAESPWGAWASPLLEFQVHDAGDTYVGTPRASKPDARMVRHLSVVLHGQGVPGKQALSDSKNRKILLKQKTSTEQKEVAAGFCQLELGAIDP